MFEQHLCDSRLFLTFTICVKNYNHSLTFNRDGQGRQRGLDCVARWLEATGLVKVLWRFRHPTPITKASATRNMRYTTGVLKRLRVAGFAKKVVGNLRYPHLTERARPSVPLGRSGGKLACSEQMLKLMA